MAELNNTYYPCLFAFLPNKKAFTYKVILAVAKREDRKKGELHLDQVVVDFVTPVIKEIIYVFGRTVKVTGCQVHFFHNLHRRQGEVENLISLIDAHPIMSEIMKAIHGLCYIPTNEVLD